ncbi:amidohydrolase family protein [Streptomyces scabiei]|uniref:amidohydrolase family protein n=1 Tax=Streptomyces TaxID=1883 RepID=UPI00298F2D98|nr:MULTISPECIES: amidohydrolase family protein [Streptomyces]MDW8471521.1 amidohydrolase family protein [Streptomyces scabiei]MDX2572017.1 amidohydrolase family protein [Streptomyces scabiei]MDX3151596.1 amidohydrolase family protein [Streptomyces scabiei]MDX3157398.1 amidohydrolase family protein [Streptomyces scabiei]MDX3256665.1 amidohydrolase family protein [Streptomyces scabiei]
MDIVDSQIHLHITLNAEETLASMNSLGIQAAVIDEFWGFEETGRVNPGILLPEHQAFRATAPGAELASIRNPERFSYLLRIHHRDPQLAAGVKAVADAPHARAVRIVARMEEDVKELAAGAYAPVFDAAADNGLPVFTMVPRVAPLLRPYAQAHPDIPIVVDHVGMPEDDTEFEDVLRLADLPNVAIKWGHGPELFHAAEYPFEPAIDKLLRVLDAFGRERVMWASDYSAISGDHRWADELFSIRESTRLSLQDKEWILGRTVRTVLNWPSPAELYTPPKIRH